MERDILNILTGVFALVWFYYVTRSMFLAGNCTAVNGLVYQCLVPGSQAITALVTCRPGRFDAQLFVRQLCRCPELGDHTGIVTRYMHNCIQQALPGRGMRPLGAVYAAFGMYTPFFFKCRKIDLIALQAYCTPITGMINQLMFAVYPVACT